LVSSGVLRRQSVASIVVRRALTFDDVPRAVDREQYDEAIALYARKVETRATAVYRVGSIGFPGLSDIDLLVVVRDSRRDNSQFFSAFNRLPHRFHRLLRHDASVLPEAALEVFRHSSHPQPLLVSGTHVLEHYQVLTTIDEHWCKLFEGYFNQEVYLSRCRQRTHISARQAVAQATSLRYVLQHFDTIYSADHAIRHAQEIDTLRSALVASPAQGSKIIAEIWNVYCQKMLWFESVLKERLPLQHDESLRQFGNRILQGNFSPDSVDSSVILSRRRRIDFYHAELARLRFSYGHLFPCAVYDSPSQRWPKSWFERRLYSMYYKVRAELAT
jgi:hypothetical protein